MSIHFSLYSHNSKPADEGIHLKLLGQSWGRLRQSDSALFVDLGLEALSAAETRWVLAKVVDNLSKTIDLSASTISWSEYGCPAAETLGTDLAHLAETIAGGPCNQAWYSAETTARRWVNEDPSVRTSLAIAAEVKGWAQGNSQLEVEILDRQQLLEAGCHLHIAVGGESKESPPRLVLVKYTPEQKTDAPLAAIIGKGITFDTGGINVKPYESFVSMMKNDMAGAATAYSLFKYLVEARVAQPLLLVIPTCENPIGSGSMRPGALVQGHAGVTVRIDHTDAEGRLILADALSYATEHYQPAHFLCFATLTTAALNGYGPFATPVHFANPKFEASLTAASHISGEDLHFFPTRLWHHEANRDHEGDVRNTARLPNHASKAAGSRNAAHFLRYFTDKPITHLDIFASGWDWSAQAPGSPKGLATGAPLRTLIQAFQHENGLQTWI